MLQSTTRRAVLGLSALLAAVGPSAGQCPQPSPLDVRPAAEPLRVTMSPGGDLDLTWEPVAVDGYRVHRGGIASLQQGLYDHLVVAESTMAATTMPTRTDDSYLLVTGNCAGETSSAGRDSFDVERPVGGVVQLKVSIVGGMGVSGVQVTVEFPTVTVFTDESLVEPIGPYDPDAPTSSFTTVNARVPGEVRAASAIVPTGPDPTFDPPADVYLMTFGYHGATPVLADFVMAECVTSDEDGLPVPDADCTLGDFTVLY